MPHVKVRMGERWAESIVLFVVVYFWVSFSSLVVRAVEKRQMLRFKPAAVIPL